MPLLRNNARAAAAVGPINNERTRYTIEGVKGLQLDCTADGARIWRCRYQVGKGEKRIERTLKLGSFNSGDPDFLTLGQAIDRAAEALVAVKRERRDPFAEHHGIGKGASFDTLFSKWLERHAKQHKKSWSVDVGLYNRHVKERLGPRIASELRRRDIIEFLDDVADNVSGIQANRSQALVSAVLNWALSEDLLETNAAHGIRKRGQETQRERVMNDKELRSFWRTLSESPVDRVLKLLLLLGQRREEVCRAPAAELRADVWLLPGARTKNALPHTVPLTRFARTLFGEGFSLHPTTASHRFRDIVRDLRMQDIRLHDLRHCCATGMAALGIPREVRERVQNQVTGRRQSISARYDQHEYLAEKRDALARWEAHLLSIVS